MLNFDKIKKIHFVGIGGIGISGLAKIFLYQKKEISGSDLAFSKNIADLKNLGAKISIGPHHIKNLPTNTELLIYTQAAKQNNPEIKAAKKWKIKVLSYPEALGILTRKKFSICISGTHGKTTTTSLISLMLTKAGFDPTCIIGSNLKEFKGNARYGKSNFFVLEADEYKGSFLNYWPKIIVLTNIEYEHPDYFKDLNQVLKIYQKYIQHLPKKGVLVANADDENIAKIIKKLKCSIVTFGIKNKNAKIFASQINLKNGYPSFEVMNYKFKLKIPGLHNIYNALAVLGVANSLKIDFKIAQKIFTSYFGAWRRFEYKGKNKEKNILIIDDYAHHPTEIKATLAAARERFPKMKIICIFQPHQYQRTKYLFNDFLGAFNDADEVIIPKIYYVAGREKAIKEVSSSKLASALKSKNVKAKYIGTFNKIIEYLMHRKLQNSVIITMGAGDITLLSDKLVKKFC